MIGRTRLIALHWTSIRFTTDPKQIKLTSKFNNMKRTLYLLMLALMYLTSTLSAQDIIFVTPDGRDSSNVDWLNGQGYNVTVWFPTDGFVNAPQSDIDMLNAADLVILGRSCPSTTFQAPHKTRWNALQVPVLSINQWGCRSSRINWFNSTIVGSKMTTSDLMKSH